MQDFFAASPNPLAPASFALAYDYTFLCAIPIELRKPWAARYAEIVHPGGVLVALMFPLDGDRVGGPPYSLSPQLYDELLGEHFTYVPRRPGAKLTVEQTDLLCKARSVHARSRGQGDDEHLEAQVEEGSGDANEWISNSISARGEPTCSPPILRPARSSW